MACPLVLGMVERHEGKMEIESREGAGTKIRLIFPERTEVENEVGCDDDHMILPPLRILCIDDSPMMREGLKEILEIDGHSPVVAEDGTIGIYIFQEAVGGINNFDAVITDLGMTGMDGWEVAERIKGLAPETPVILLTGWGNLMDEDEEATPNVEAILGKPPKINEIREVLCRLFAAREGNGD